MLFGMHTYIALTSEVTKVQQMSIDLSKYIVQNCVHPSACLVDHAIMVANRARSDIGYIVYIALTSKITKVQQMSINLSKYIIVQNCVHPSVCLVDHAIMLANRDGQE